jgi:uncharacterized protein YcbK (DUF882 family)
MTSVCTLTIENLRRKNFAPKDFLKSKTADASLKDADSTNDIRNIPNYSQLTAGMVLADKMQQIRDAIKKPIEITSAFRSPQLNKEVDGAPNSWHMQFLACDFNIAGLEPHEAVLAIKATKISVDKVFVERGCVHLQTCFNEASNRNSFGSAKKDSKGNWVVTNKIEKV